MNILGIIASSKLGVDAGDFESIATVSVGSGGAADVEFTSIPATYQHLEIRGILRDNRSIGSNIWWSDLFVQMGNGSIDTGSNYAMHRIWGENGGTPGSGESTSQTKINWWECVPNTQYIAADIFNGTVISILDYANTNKFKTVRGLMGFDSNSVQSRPQFASGLWRSTSAVTNIRISTSATLQQYSQLALYGIRSA
jgi:hypothetical protein